MKGVQIMMDSYTEIDEVIAYMHHHLHEPISLRQLARHISYSPYHFSRLFKKRTGLTPLYYVSSIRLQKAKNLLLESNHSIRDIGMEIGQQSLGTFTTRFTERVGVTPSQFRNSTSLVDQHLSSLKNLNDWSEPLLTSNPYEIVEGEIESEVPFHGITLVGLFQKPIPEGLPLYGTLLSSLGPFCFKDVKPGTYYLMATSISWGMQAKDVLLPQTTLRARSKEPIIVVSGSYVPFQRIKLHLPRLDDPPIIISLPLLMENFMNRIFQHSNR